MVFAAVLLAGGTVACGGAAESDSAKEDPTKVAPATAVAKAATNSEDIRSLHYRITGTVPEKGRLEAEASMNTEPLTMSMKMTAAGQDGDSRLEVRFVGEVMYVGGSAVDSEKLGGKSWFRAAPAAWGRGAVDNDSHGVLPRQIEGNPVVQSTLLTGSEDLRMIGTETVDGTRTRHYKGTVTSGGLLAARTGAVDEAARERLIESLDQFMGLGVSDTLTMDLWIDGDDQAKQFRMRAESDDKQTGAGGGPLDLTITFLDINQPVSIKTPPTEDTTALTDGAQGS
ncbi:hypothetical protein ACPMJQ_16705 [Streptomyces pseudogriseolus]|uniref:hypothetical protein n=1 Tax=Streptomyces pseudogriseolus TaxID=36817 RepID=UPI003FA27CCC